MYLKEKENLYIYRKISMPSEKKSGFIGPDTLREIFDKYFKIIDFLYITYNAIRDKIVNYGNIKETVYEKSYIIQISQHPRILKPQSANTKTSRFKQRSGVFDPNAQFNAIDPSSQAAAQSESDLLGHKHNN